MTTDDASHTSIFFRELEDNLWAMWSTFGRGPGCSLHQGNNLLWFETPLPIVPFNGVLRFQVQTGVDLAIGRIVDHFRKRKAQFMWVLHPSARPARAPTPRRPP